MKYCCSGKAVSITYFEGVFVAFHIRHAIRMRHIFLSALLYSVFPHYLINCKIFEKPYRGIKCVFWYSLQIFSETFLVLRRTKRDMIKKCILVFMCITVILVRFKWHFNFLGRYSKNTQIPNLMKICPVGPELCRANRRRDGQTDRYDESDSRFS